MSISEKANDLLNKFGSAQFDFMIWNTPDNLVARDKARQEISDHIAELEAAQRWIPVTEGLPEAKGYYMAVVVDGFDDSRSVETLRYFGDGDWFTWSDWYTVTHWKEKPELPEVQE